ncbi:hypothetical protein DIURU_003559 [Diutina rugosa]|uniref:Amino acid transporter transmembrane domain-containing protein n=1 Tax=Diutina rugosa TaxID=5481 RepID=A0A642ULK4_DIURU|nr:uncharacterized protein DIURU_003559 [Diutina rugosa]KAA8901189.1 hypothetical protein DIURU_003559 [Diutina rugosa]
MTDPSSAVPIERPRRRSFMDIGGVNSLSHFATSYTRAQGYLGSEALEEDGISPTQEIPADIASHSAGRRQQHGGHNHIKTFSFPEADRQRAALLMRPASETSPLLESAFPQGDHHDDDSDTASVRTSYSMALPSGNSTAPQTVFNSVNTLIGIGMLSLPFALHLAGWIPGMVLLTSSAVITCITAIVLGGIIRRMPHLKTYGDIAQAYGGPYFALAVTFLFSLDLLGASLSLVILFADSFTTVLPWWPAPVYKAIIASIVFLLSFVPLNILSLTSFMGIVCTVSVIVLIVSCGLMLDTPPGSLLQHAKINAWPVDWPSFCLSLGLFLSVWGGHPVFPELYRDMRHPSKFSKTCRQSFVVTYSVDAGIAVVGFLMYGINCEDSIIKNIMGNSRYPNWVNPLLCVFMGILPVSKLPLVTRPLITVYESYFGLNRLDAVKGNGRHYSLGRVLARLAFCGLLFTLSIVFTSFGQVVSFLGSAICFTICVSLPCLFYVYFDQPPMKMRILAYAVSLLGFVGAIVGTWASVTMPT